MVRLVAADGTPRVSLPYYRRTLFSGEIHIFGVKFHLSSLLSICHLNFGRVWTLGNLGWGKWLNGSEIEWNPGGAM